MVWPCRLVQDAPSRRYSTPPSRRFESHCAGNLGGFGAPAYTIDLWRSASLEGLRLAEWSRLDPSSSPSATADIELDSLAIKRSAKGDPRSPWGPPGTGAVLEAPGLVAGSGRSLDRPLPRKRGQSGRLDPGSRFDDDHPENEVLVPGRFTTLATSVVARSVGPLVRARTNRAASRKPASSPRIPSLRHVAE